MKIDKEQIATICHEANRAYCAALGDFSQPHWNDAPQWQRDSAINGVTFHWNTLESGGEPKPEASHESWMEEKRAAGWVYGPVKSESMREHPCFVPYSQLPVEQRLKDYIFAGIVKSVWLGLVSEVEPVEQLESRLAPESTAGFLE